MDMLAEVIRFAAMDAPAGQEYQAAYALEDALRPSAQRWSADPCGNILLGRGVAPALWAMVAAMDEPGIAVAAYEQQGFARVTPRGTWDVHSLVGTRWRFGGHRGVVGLEPSEDPDAKATWDRLYLDLGYLGRQSAEAAIPLGTAGVPDTDVHRMGDGLICGKALGRAASLAIMGEVLRRSAGPCAAVLVAQSHLGGRGIPAAFGRQPAQQLIGIGPAAATDTPAHHRTLQARVGGGPVLVLQDREMVASPAVVAALRKAAQDAGIPMQVTAADPGSHPVGLAGRAGLGAAVALLGFPVRHAGTPAEVCSLGDLEAVAAILVVLLGL